MKKAIKRYYGYLPDLGDHRDREMLMGVMAEGEMPTSVDLRPVMPGVFDQGRTSSCVAQATATAWWYAHSQGDRPTELASRLFLYYEARRLEGRQIYDSGCMIRDGIKVLVVRGVCPETEWPFAATRINQKPPAPCYTEALKDQVSEYMRLGGVESQFKQCLADGFPFVTGLSLYESFESKEVAKTGLVPMPGHRERMVGGHAILVVGYFEDKRMFLCRNSWGEKWGMKGYFMIPYSYLCHGNLATDHWTIRKVEA